MAQNEIKILMIDDDHEDFMIVRDIIKDNFHHKYTIDWKPSYEEGLKSISEKKHNVYLVDYKLGAKTGLDLVKKSIELGCEAPLIILTGENNFEIDKKALKAGAADYMVKGTISGQILESSIRYAIANAKHIKEMNKLNSELEERVKSRTIILEETLNKLEWSQNELIEAKNKAELAAKIAEDASKSKTLFLSSMSHEIRTPMNAIIGFTKIALETDLNEKQKEYLNAIKTSGEILIVLINDILDLAKVEAGKITFENTAFNLKNSISEILQLFETKINEQNLELITEYDPNLPEILIGDSARLNQIILNLVGNAVKFTAKGKIIVSIHLLNEDAEKAKIEFQITDTGIGISENEQLTIFDKFQQANNETSRLFGGTGLGLAIAKQLVELQGGTIDVRSKVNEGSTFRFVLNYYKSKSIPQIGKKNEIHVNTSSQKIKILVAENEILNQLLMKTILEKFGFEMDIASNGKVAVEKLKKNNYDLILMDLQMPEMNGFEATEYIRNKKKSDIPIIALTANVISADVEKCKASGMNDYISKPIDTTILYNTIIKYTKKIPDTIVKSTEESRGHNPENNSETGKFRVINYDYLNELSDSNPVVISKIISAYLEEVPQLLQTMKTSIDNSDWEGLRSSAHSIIPCFALVEVNNEFEDIARTIEQLAIEKDNLEEINNFFQKINNVWTQACEELKNELTVL